MWIQGPKPHPLIDRVVMAPGVSGTADLVMVPGVSGIVDLPVIAAGVLGMATLAPGVIPPPRSHRIDGGGGGREIYIYIYIYI